MGPAGIEPATPWLLDTDYDGRSLFPKQIFSPLADSNEGWNKLAKNLKAEIDEFVNYYNNERYHESLNNLTPADVYYGRDKQILEKRKEVKRKTLKRRRLEYQKSVILYN